ncbi:TPA: hypothetical protein U0T37_003267, partial [Legionella pneumophila]|nr:hypothetical protein [Legionella pneumophila]
MSMHKCKIIPSAELKTERFISIFKKYKLDKLQCQFEKYTNQLYEFESEFFCEFHLPWHSSNKKDIDFDSLINEVMNDFHTDFSFISMDKLCLNFGRYKEKYKAPIMFSGVTLSDFELIDFSSEGDAFNRILFRDSYIIGNFKLSNINFIEITFERTTIDVFEENLPELGKQLRMFDPYQVVFHNLHDVNLYVNESKIRTGVLIQDHCKIYNFHVKNSVFGWENEIENNLYDIRVNIGKIKIHSFQLKNTSIYTLIDVRDSKEIINMDF